MGGAFGRAFLGATLALALAPAKADPIKHPKAIFAGLDKITGRIKNFEVLIDETVQFGALLLTPRVCNTRPQTETPQTTTFVEVDEQAAKPDQKIDPAAARSDSRKYEVKRIFSGWMFAGSPGLHGVEHPVYDIWLVDCKGGKEVVAQPAPQDAQPAAAAAAAQPDKPDKPRSGRMRRVEPRDPDAQRAGASEDPVFGAENDAAQAAPAPRPQQPRRERRRRAAPAASPSPAQSEAPAPAPQPQGRGPFGLF